MLSRRWILNYLLILFTGILILAGNRYWGQSASEPDNPITDLKPADIDRVSFEYEGVRFALSKSSDQWQLEKPVQWPANNVAVARIITILTSESQFSIAIDEVDLATLGLQEPKLTLMLNDTPVLFGTTNNIGARRYVLIGSTVYLLNDVYLPFMVQGVSGLLDRRLLPQSISLQSLNPGNLNLIKNATGAWVIANKPEIGSDQVNRLIANWQTMEAAGMRKFDESSAAQEKIAALLTDGSSIEFLLMSLEPELVIARPDLKVQYHFTKKYFNDLFSIEKGEF